ncbi:MAG: ABC transporter permease [Thermodesulfobacteriota bacterium]
MNLRHIAFSNLRRRKAKAGFILVGLLIGVSAVVAFTSLISALTHDINDKLEKYGANILIVPETENLSLSYGGLSLGGISFDVKEIRQDSLQKLRTIKNSANIAALGPMVLGAVKAAGHNVLLAGMDFEVSRFLRPWWKVTGTVPDGEGVLLGSEAARILRLQAGDRVVVNGRSLTVTGTLEATGSQDDHLLFVRLPTAQSILGKEGRISIAEVAALCAGCPIEDMIKQISEVLPGAKVMGIRQVVEGRMEALHHFARFGIGISGLVMLVGALVVLVTMMGSVRERTPEFGIFRAIGFRRGHLVQIVLLEAGIISAVSGITGYLIGLFTAKAAAPLFTMSTNIHVPLDPALAAGVFLLAMVLGLGSSAYPALMAAKLDPHEALRTL